MKVCPDCAEEVRIAARKCRFCGFVFENSVVT
jgi:rubredoxin